jgi:hypothetical protein
VLNPIVEELDILENHEFTEICDSQCLVGFITRLDLSALGSGPLNDGVFKIIQKCTTLEERRNSKQKSKYVDKTLKKKFNSSSKKIKMSAYAAPCLHLMRN